MRVLALTALAGALCIFTAKAQDLSVFRAQLNGPSGVTDGKVVIAGNRIIFVDDAQPSQSFWVDRADVRQLNFANGLLTVDLGRPVTDRWGTQSNIVLRTDDPRYVQQLVTWAGVPLVGTLNPRTDESGDVSLNARPLTGNTMMFDGTHGDETGKLIVKPEGVSWESISKRDHSRTWLWSDISALDRNVSESEIKIKPVRGDEFKVKLGSSFQAAYDMLSNRLVAARQGLRPVH